MKKRVKNSVPLKPPTPYRLVWQNAKKDIDIVSASQRSTFIVRCWSRMWFLCYLQGRCTRGCARKFCRKQQKKKTVTQDRAGDFLRWCLRRSSWHEQTVGDFRYELEGHKSFIGKPRLSPSRSFVPYVGSCFHDREESLCPCMLARYRNTPNPPITCSAITRHYDSHARARLRHPAVFCE